jgi:DNA-binding CsgD family transcriptional regulator
LGAEAAAIYLQDLYRLDPLLRLVRTQVRDRVLTSQQLHSEEPGNVYFEDLYRSARIFDELVVLLPAVGGIWVALCLDRDERPFSPAEVAHVRQIYPLIERLHRLHIDCCLSGGRGGYLNDSPLAVMVVDSLDSVCFRNAIWSGKVVAADEATIRQASLGSPEGVISLNDVDVVHWERLEATHAVAPAGLIFVLEHRSPGYLDIDTLLGRMATDHQLTPRECEIVRHSLRGLSTAAIARRLAVSVGTVRNHKHRLYHKLNVTCEREIASLVLARIFKSAGN